MDGFIWICIGLYLFFCVVGFLKVDSDGDIRTWSDWVLFDSLGLALSIMGYIGFPGIIIHKILIKRKKRLDMPSEEGKNDESR